MHTTPADDLAFLRALAQSGRRTRLTCGPYVLAAGLLFGLASVIAWAMTLDPARFAPSAQSWLWLAAGLAYVPVVLWLNRTTRATEGAATTINRAIASVWTGLSVGIAAMFACCLILEWRAQSPLVWVSFPSILLALYGAGWTATAFISGRRWLHGVTVASMGGALLCAATIGSPATYLIYGGLLLAVLALPGYLLVKSDAP